jgi:hypothetical protein
MRCNAAETRGRDDACVFREAPTQEPAMTVSTSHPLTDLPRDGTLRFDDGKAHVIAVFEGQVWLTQEGDVRDVILEAGESFVFGGPGLVLVQAFRDARVLLSEPTLH